MGSGIREFSAYTFIWPAPEGVAPFAATAMQALPQDWLRAIPGEVLVVTRLDLRAQTQPPLSLEAARVLLYL